MSLFRSSLFRRSAGWLRLVAVAASGAALWLALSAEQGVAKTGAKADFFEVGKSIELLGNVYKEVSQQYVEPINVSEFMYSGIDGMLSQLDPYTVLLDKEQSVELEKVTSGQYAGIGITIGTIGRELYVTSVFEGEAAANAGVQVGDQIIAVNRLRVADRPMEEIREAIKGAPGTVVRLKVRKDGRGPARVLRLTRSEVRVDTVPFSGLFGSVGYIRMTNFTERTPSEMSEAIRALKQQASGSKSVMSGLLLDLRGNPGGLLDSAIDVAALFVGKGSRVVSTEGRRESSAQSYVTKVEPLLPTLPLVVLIDGDSASASEILSGAIQELDRGVIVGQNSYGKGLVQSVLKLPYDHSLKLTTARYYTPSGRLIQKPRLHGNEQCADSLRKVLYSEAAYDSTKVFYTGNRRKVYGGGGIKPDLLIKPEEPSEYEKALKKEGLLFRYASRFHRNNPDIALSQIAPQPLFKELKRFADENSFVFRSAAQQQLDSLKTMIGTEEGEPDSLLAQKFDAFNKALASWTTQNIQRDSLRITSAVHREIIRHYDEQAAWRKGIEQDSVAAKAFSLLADQKRYRKLLKP